MSKCSVGVRLVALAAALCAWAVPSGTALANTVDHGEVPNCSSRTCSNSYQEIIMENVCGVTHWVGIRINTGTVRAGAMYVKTIDFIYFNGTPNSFVGGGPAYWYDDGSSRRGGDSKFDLFDSYGYSANRPYGVAGQKTMNVYQSIARTLVIQKYSNGLAGEYCGNITSAIFRNDY